MPERFLTPGQDWFFFFKKTGEKLNEKGSFLFLAAELVRGQIVVVIVVLYGFPSEKREFLCSCAEQDYACARPNRTDGDDGVYLLLSCRDNDAAQVW